MNNDRVADEVERPETVLQRIPLTAWLFSVVWAAAAAFAFVVTSPGAVGGALLLGFIATAVLFAAHDADRRPE